MIQMMFFGGLWFVAIIAFLVWLVTGGRFGSPMQQQQQPPRQEDAIEIARQRYARGEISKEELEEIKRTLSGTAA